ncbi:PilZ domain-containing protein [Rhodopirellula sp. JC639]|uniref:PilZ domain-containing protein n=1 Tax=Stieleria mannarensis TaxID=2755585 RepID=UPI0015FEE168|nr:PilZ domain-containing protein [Rhodopirellula sp. JC639]
MSTFASPISASHPSSPAGSVNVERSLQAPVEDDRYEPRFRVVAGDQASGIECHLSVRLNAAGDFRVPCQLLDLNSSGCAIRYRHPRPLGTSSTSTVLEMNNLANSDSVQLLVRVCWVRQAGIDQYECGLYFRRSLPDTLIPDGIRAGQLSRRVAKRASVDAAVTVRQSQPRIHAAGRIVSVSHSGAQIVSPSELTIGEKLMLQLDDKQAAVGVTVWSSRHGDQFASGIAFIQAGMGRQFHDAVVGLD